MRTLIVHNKPYDSAETFVKAQVDHLPGEVEFFCYKKPASIGSNHFLARSTIARIGLFAYLVMREGHLGVDKEIVQHSYKRAITKIRPDVVLAQYGMTGTLLAPICEATNTPLVVHFHGHDATRDSVLAHYGEDYRKMFKVAAATIAVSEPMRKKLLGLGANNATLHVNRYGIDCEKFFGANPETAGPTFLAVGRFTEKKAPYLTLLAFKAVLDKVPTAQLRCVGDGALLGMCQDIATATGIAHAVTFLGKQTHEVIQNEMRSARAFVQHSVTAADGDSEGTPVAILEASATGLPVVATKHAGIPDVILNGKTGLLVDERDVDGMAKEMIRIATEPQTAREMGAAGAAHIREHLTLQQSISRLHDILSKAVS